MNLKIVKYLFLAFLLSSCAKNSIQLTQYPFETSQELQDVISKFERIYHTKVDYTVTFVRDSEIKPKYGNAAGVCQRVVGDGSNQRQILINKDWWDQQDQVYSAFKEMVVFHELGHCHFFRDHDNTIKEDGYPKSIMMSSNSQLLYVYSWFYNYYLSELSSTADLSQVSPQSKTSSFDEPKIIEEVFSSDGECLNNKQNKH